MKKMGAQKTEIMENVKRLHELTAEYENQLEREQQLDQTSQRIEERLKETEAREKSLLNKHKFID